MSPYVFVDSDGECHDLGEFPGYDDEQNGLAKAVADVVKPTISNTNATPVAAESAAGKKATVFVTIDDQEFARINCTKLLADAGEAMEMARRTGNARASRAVRARQNTEAIEMANEVIKATKLSNDLEKDLESAFEADEAFNRPAAVAFAAVPARIAHGPTATPARIARAPTAIMQRSGENPQQFPKIDNRAFKGEAAANTIVGTAMPTGCFAWGVSQSNLRSEILDRWGKVFARNRSVWTS
ncbi:hypothetical protein VE04_04660 [Pseudogymnoascus sp. 24MN13]|nr:hypothetical protein VE04_04660 [Pseudogymnoascus sp. 24MN13]